MLSPQFSYAQVTAADTTDVMNMSLEDLMKHKSVGVPSLMDEKIATVSDIAAGKPLAIRKSPSILSIITAEEIERSGARDLMDILNLVPGLDFGVDVEGVVGIGVRGNWGHEGKVLILLDGQELNETVYGTLQFGSSFQMDNIKRIEIIRGPGSAIYGGAAEYAVINIVSKNENDGNKVNLTTVYGCTEKTMARNNYSLSGAKKIKDFGMSLNAFLGTTIRSDRMYTDIYNKSYDMTDNSKINSLNFNLGINYKNLSLRALYLNNFFETRDGYEQAYDNPYKEYFKTLALEAKYVIKFSEKFSLIPKLSFKRNSPWEVSANETSNALEMEEAVYKTVAYRYKLNLTSVYDATKNFTITYGVEGFYDIANKFDGNVFRNSNKQMISYRNGAVFAQSILKNKIANLTIGARFDYNNSFGNAFVPRLGLTKRINKFNFKVLYSQSFKAPTIENVETSLLGEIMPEKTSICEFETSLQITRNMFLTLNIFDITTKNTIIYDLDTSLIYTGIPDGYINASASGSQGLEVEYKIAEKWGHINFSYSFYTKQNTAVLPYFEDPFDKNQTLGFGSNKASISATYNISNSIYLSPSIIYKSKKTAITGINKEDEYVYTELPSTCAINIFFGKNNFIIKNLKASIGAYNILNQKISYVQPYASGHAPLPGISREFLVRMSYTLK